MMRVLVAGASGTVGRELVAELLAAGVDVVALTREPEAAALPAGVETASGDLYEPAGLAPALARADAAFLLWPSFSPDGSQAAIETICAHVRRVVYLSAESAAPGTVWATVEARIAGSADAWTFLRPTGFAKNTLLWAPQVPGGVVEWPFGRAARSLIDERDIAAVAARALIEPGHDGRTYVLSGPAAVTQIEQARLIGSAIGVQVRWREQDRATARDALAGIFGGPGRADRALDTWERFVTEPETVTFTVEQLTGRPARSFAEWARDHADAFR